MPVALDLNPDRGGARLHHFVGGVHRNSVWNLPAWRCSLLNPADRLRQGAHGLTPRTGKLGKALVSSQIAFSLVLLLGAALLAQSLAKLRSSDLGFRMDHVLEVSLYPRPGGYQGLAINSYHNELLERVSNIPGRSRCRVFQQFGGGRLEKKAALREPPFFGGCCC